jgi:hypothetical protein
LLEPPWEGQFIILIQATNFLLIPSKDVDHDTSIENRETHIQPF